MISSLAWSPAPIVSPILPELVGGFQGPVHGLRRDGARLVVDRLAFGTGGFGDSAEALIRMGFLLHCF
jgi:hypothetical protein